MTDLKALDLAALSAAVSGMNQLTTLRKALEKIDEGARALLNAAAVAGDLERRQAALTAELEALTATRDRLAGEAQAAEARLAAVEADLAGLAGEQQGLVALREQVAAARSAVEAEQQRLTALRDQADRLEVHVADLKRERVDLAQAVTR